MFARQDGYAFSSKFGVAINKRGGKVRMIVWTATIWIL